MQTHNYVEASVVMSPDIHFNTNYERYDILNCYNVVDDLRCDNIDEKAFPKGTLVVHS